MRDGIDHVSDTALLVAAARAAETQEPDGLMRDPFAALLAGERGFAIARSGTPSRWRSFGIGLRTRFIDEFLLAAIQNDGVDCVLSLGAGLDARPWRLDLPSTLTWLEADFEPILDYKHAIMQDVLPRCQLDRLVTDLNDPAERKRVFEQGRCAGSNVLLLTEGLLFYLPAGTVRSLANEALFCARWIMDVSPATSFLLSAGGDSMRQANQVRDETRLEGRETVLAAFDAGWSTVAYKTFAKDAGPFARQRMLQKGWTPNLNTARLSPDDPAGIWLFKPKETEESPASPPVCIGL